MKPKIFFKCMAMSLILFFLIAAPGFSEIKVYDANDQYIGVLFGDGEHTGQQISIFMPQLEMPVFFHAYADGEIDESYTGVQYETDDCSGTPYIRLNSGVKQFIIRDGEGACKKYYTITRNRKSFVPGSFYNSSCECIQSTASNSDDYLELSLFPEENFPFSLPVAIPFHFKYSSGGDISGDGKIGLEEAVNALQVTSGLKE